MHKHITYKIDRDKSISVILFILNELNKVDIHKLFKIIYFADQKHLAKYGRPITGDCYIAMKDGPVPSTIYDFIKIARGDSMYQDKELMSKIEIHGHYYAIPKEKPDLNELSETDLECLKESILENKKLNYDQLVNKSHDGAYNKADKNNMIAFEDIAQIAGANEELLKYIAITAENNKIALRNIPETC